MIWGPSLEQLVSTGLTSERYGTLKIYTYQIDKVLSKQSVFFLSSYGFVRIFFSPSHGPHFPFHSGYFLPALVLGPCNRVIQLSSRAFALYLTSRRFIGDGRGCCYLIWVAVFSSVHF